MEQQRTIFVRRYQPRHRLYKTRRVKVEVKSKKRSLRSSLQPCEQIVAELLPEGPWIQGEKHGDTETTDNAWPISVPDPERLSFLESLAPETTLIVKGALGTRRIYQPFVYRRPDGRKVAIVATDRTQNADYAFWADTPEWIEVAQRTKLDVLTGPYPEFIARVIHRGNWRTRILKLLQTEPER